MTQSENNQGEPRTAGAERIATVGVHQEPIDTEVDWPVQAAAFTARVFLALAPVLAPLLWLAVIGAMLLVVDLVIAPSGLHPAWKTGLALAVAMIGWYLSEQMMNIVGDRARGGRR